MDTTAKTQSSKEDSSDGTPAVAARATTILTGEQSDFTSATWTEDSQHQDDQEASIPAEIKTTKGTEPDLENPTPKGKQTTNLVLERRAKLFQGCRTFSVHKNGEKVGTLCNGGTRVVRDVAKGDCVEISYEGSHRASYNTLVLVVNSTSRPLSCRLKKTGDVSFYLVLVGALIFMASVLAGYTYGMLALPVSLLLASSSLYKYCRDSEFRKEIVPCNSNNRDIEEYSLLLVEHRPAQTRSVAPLG
ncbi:expressed unknown protein [Seminavis robusta]|uniref:Uncharacterized protein n=1 Tax=Seminavis robusta TaxID=568900 RepID=A0A9N8DQD7_9STRA|nr:expressed unknown protein [Seminavis robusta]|eukprot:Sro213_g088430.1 n/a (246) ;mRNA; f:41227-41964